MESEENVALLEKQKQCLKVLGERHAELVEKLQELEADYPDPSEIEDVREVYP
jgi:hypothetical protein